MQRIRGKLTYANVMATVAVFIALGGAGYAATALPKNSVGTKQIKSGAITGAKIKNGAVTGAKIQTGSLGTVPSADHANTANTATSATSANTANTANSANTAGTAASATNAAHATTADRATVAGATETLPALEPVQVAALENGCANANVSLFGPAGYYEDGFGIVHLTGALTNCTKNENAFVLPPSFRPSVAIIHASTGGEAGAEIEVLPTGEVRPFLTSSPSLGGITFRTN